MAASAVLHTMINSRTFADIMPGYTSLGQSDFRRIRTQNLYFVDKTDFIRCVHESNTILLLARPCRFGKTLTLSMLRYFYGREGDYRSLFEGLSIEKNVEIMQWQATANQGSGRLNYVSPSNARSERICKMINLYIKISSRSRILPHGRKLIASLYRF